MMEKEVVVLMISFLLVMTAFGSGVLRELSLGFKGEVGGCRVEERRRAMSLREKEDTIHGCY